MKIGPVEAGRTPERTSKNCSPAEATTEKKASSGDRLEISNNVRQRLGELADQARSNAGSANPERRATVDQVRQRILEGYYNQVDVRQLIAENIAEDLQN